MVVNTLLPEHDGYSESDELILGDKTFCIDFQKGRVIGMIDGFDALLQSLEIMLQTPRFKHEIFSWNYGNELYNCIGKPYDEVVLFATQYITAALKSDNRVKDVYDFEFNKSRDYVQISFKIDTVYGEAERSLTVKND